MKLKFNKSSSIVPLREADENQGRRVIYIENVIKALKPAVEAKKYKFKADSDVTKGFHILPGQKFLSKIVFNLNSSSGQIEVKVIKNDNSLVDLKDGASINVTTLMQEKPDEGESTKLENDIKAFAETVNSQILLTTLGESLNESAVLLEYGPLGNLFNKIKNAASKNAANKADKKAEKQAEADVVDSFSGFPQMAQEIIKGILEGQNLTSLKLESNASKTSAEYTIFPATGAIVSVALASTDDKKSLRVVKVINAAGANVTVSDPSLAKVLEGIGKKFNIDVAAVCKVASGEASSETDAETNVETEENDEIDNVTNDEIDHVLPEGGKISQDKFKSTYKDRLDELKALDETKLRELLGTVEGFDKNLLKALQQDTLIKVVSDMIK